MKKHYIKPAKSSSKFYAFLLLAGVVGIGTAKAQFSGAYAPSNWTSVVNGSVGGSINTSGAPGSISITSGNNMVQGVTTYQITIPASGTISFDWNYSTTDDPGFDIPQYSINGTTQNLSGYNTSTGKTQSGTQAGITVHAGDVFALIMYTDDGQFGAATTVFSNFTTSNAPLAITLENISASVINGKNLITWNTAKEDRGDYFELERSANGKDFARIATINANEKPSQYTYVDAPPVSGVNYYRLKMLDVAGKTEYSKVVTVADQSNGQSNIAIKAFPNPAADYVTVNINDAQATGQLYVTDVAGKTVQSAAVAGVNTVLNTTDLPVGIYTITYKAGGNTVSTQLVKK